MILYIISSLSKLTSSSREFVPKIKFFSLLVVEYSFFINNFRALIIKVILASSLIMSFSFVKGNLVIIKSIPVLTVGISFSSITWHRALMTTVFMLGY